jgi:hypothetical protein
VLEAAYATNIIGEKAGAAYSFLLRPGSDGIPMKYLGAASIWMMAFIVTVVFAQSGLTQETKRIRFALTTPPHFLPIWVAKDLGYSQNTGSTWK